MTDKLTRYEKAQVSRMVTKGMVSRKLTKVESIGADVALIVVDMYIQGKGSKPIAEHINKFGHNLTGDDIKTFVKKYDKLTKRKMDGHKKIQQLVMKRFANHAKDIDEMILTAKKQLEVVGSDTEMSVEDKTRSLSLMIKTLMDVIKTDGSIHGKILNSTADKQAPTTNVNIVQKISNDKQHLRSEILKADFSNEEVIDVEFTEIKEEDEEEDGEEIDYGDNLDEN